MTSKLTLTKPTIFVSFSVGAALEDLEFLSQPSVLSLAINNRTTTFPNNTEVIITFPHRESAEVGNQMQLYRLQITVPVVPRRGSLLRVLGLPEPQLERGGLRGGHRLLHPHQDRVPVGGRAHLTTVQCCDQVRPPHQLRGAVRRERLAGRLGRGPDGDPQLPLYCPHVPLHPRILRNCGHLAVLKVVAFSS